MTRKKTRKSRRNLNKEVFIHNGGWIAILGISLYFIYSFLGVGAGRSVAAYLEIFEYGSETFKHRRLGWDYIVLFLPFVNLLLFLGLVILSLWLESMVVFLIGFISLIVIRRIIRCIFYALEQRDYYPIELRRQTTLFIQRNIMGIDDDEE